MSPLIPQGQLDPQTFNQPNIAGQERVDPMSLYDPYMVVNSSNSPRMIGHYPGLNQYPPGMMNRSLVPQQQQMMRMPVTPNRMMSPLNAQPPQLGSINTNRYSTPFQTYATTNMKIYNRLLNTSSSSSGHNFATAAAVSTNVNRPLLSPQNPPHSPYNTLPTPSSYQHMIHDPLLSSGSNISRYHLGYSTGEIINTISSVPSNSLVTLSDNSHQLPV